MHAEQISIFLENKAGRLSEVTRIFEEGRINIRALSLADTSDFGILRLIVNDNEKAKRLLKENGFTVRITEVVAVEVQDKPGGLHQILTALSPRPASTWNTCTPLSGRAARTRCSSSASTTPPRPPRCCAAKGSRSSTDRICTPCKLDARS